MYTTDYRSDFGAKWICAPDIFLEKFNRPKAEEFKAAKFIWGRRYTRAYFRRLFRVNKAVKSAFFRFICDNSHDVFLNGNAVSSDMRDTGRVDIAAHITDGENLLMIRAYQTAVPDSFTSALTGGIHIEYTDGTSEDILTDESFENIRFIDFWETDEPEGWELFRTANNEVRNQLITTDMHAIAIKRSCLFRKDFTVSGNVKKATLAASALGCYEPHLNGCKIDDIYFSPSSMDKVKEYQTYDVTARIGEGKNTLSAITGSGWYNCESWGSISANKPALLMELTVEYTDGRKEIIGTDESWDIIESPLTDNDIQFGERYDGTLEREEWDTPECDISAWHKAATLTSPPYSKLLLQNYPPVRTIRRLPVKLIGKLPCGAYLFDCGTNIAGAVDITLRNTVRGQRIRISVSERLNEEGNLEIGSYVAPYFPQDSHPDGKAPYNLRNTNIYIAKGAKTEHYSPRFCYTGFRYIRIDGICPDAADISVREMHNDLAITGNFRSGDETLNRLWDAVKQTWVNNCYNGPTDCPTREKNFWTGDTMIFSHLACWYTDCEAFLSRWTDLGRKMTGPYGWDDEEYMLPFTLYRFYGDQEILRVKYERIVKFVNDRRAECEGGYLPVNPFSCYNDWLNPTGQNLTPKFFSHCWYLRMLDIASKIAETVGDADKSKLWKDEFNKGKEEFNKLYYDCERGEYKEHIQSSAVLPLAFGLVPCGQEQRVADALHSVLSENGFCLTTGFQASRYILDVLTDFGYGEDAIKLLHQDKFPSWKYILDSGATNITESWYAMNDADKSVSMCHFSLGGAFAWFFEYLGGIRIYECAPGFEEIVLEPHCFEILGHCGISYNTRHGKIVSEWHFENGKLIWNHTVPDGIKATVRKPHIYRLQERS